MMLMSELKYSFFFFIVHVMLFLTFFLIQQQIYLRISHFIFIIPLFLS